MPVATLNLGGHGGGPFETAYIADQIARCPVRPRRVLLSLSIHSFTRVENTWEMSIRNRFLPNVAVHFIRDFGARLGDHSLDEVQSTDKLPHALRPWAYDVRFPSIFVGGLIEGLLVGREARNLVLLNSTVANRGYLRFGDQPEWRGVGPDGHLAVFRPLPVLNAFFERTVSRLQQSGIEVDYATMPVNEASFDEIEPAAREAYAAYIASFASRYQLFHIVGEPLPRWPANYFGDVGLHLNARGADVLSRQYAACLASEPVSTCPLGREPDDNHRPSDSSSP